MKMMKLVLFDPALNRLMIMLIVQFQFVISWQVDKLVPNNQVFMIKIVECRIFGTDALFTTVLNELFIFFSTNKIVEVVLEGYFLRFFFF